MNSDTLEDRIVFLELKTLSGVLAVFGGDVARSAGHTARFVLGAFENYLHAITFSFLCHGRNYVERVRLKIDVFDLCEITLLGCVLNSCVEAFLINGAEAGSRNCEGDPSLLLNPVELFVEEIHVEFALGATFRVRNVVAHHRFFARDLTNL